MSSEEFALHVAYWSREPTGPAGQMWMWAGLMAATANGQVTRKDKRLWQRQDFWPEDLWKPPPPPPPPGAKKARLAPDFSGLRGMKYAKAKRSNGG